MKNASPKIRLCLFILFLCFSNLYAQEDCRPKKLIVFQGYRYYDWAPTVAKNSTAMQSQHPYIKGIVFHLGKEMAKPLILFDKVKWDKKELFFADLKTIQKNTTSFKDNFLLVWAHSTQTGFDFFDDTAWAVICSNAELLGEAVKTSGSRGIMFDPEYYAETVSYNPWWYGKKNQFEPPYIKRGQSFETVKQKATQRGYEFVKALQKKCPSLKIMTTFLYSYVWAYCYGNIDSLPQSNYALLGAFADGMLKGLNATSSLIDGNETSYYINETRKYTDAIDENSYAFAKYTAPLKIADAAVLPIWQKKGGVAFAPYLELCYNRYSEKKWSTPTYQSNWLKHNVYHSLLHNDEHVWMYVESFNFWTGDKQPAESSIYNDIIISDSLYQSKKPLGFDMFKPTKFLKHNFDTASLFINQTAAVTFKLEPKDNNQLSVQILLEDKASATKEVAEVQYFVNSEMVVSSSTYPYEKTLQLKTTCNEIFARIYYTNGTYFTSQSKLYTTNQ